MPAAMPDRSQLEDAFARIVGPFAATGSALRAGLRWASQHTGLPVILVGGLVLVASFRVAKHSMRFAVELALATALLFLATEFGWIRW
jgi:hypothetical protein